MTAATLVANLVAAQAEYDRQHDLLVASGASHCAMNRQYDSAREALHAASLALSAYVTAEAAKLHAPQHPFLVVL